VKHETLTFVAYRDENDALRARVEAEIETQRIEKLEEEEAQRARMEAEAEARRIAEAAEDEARRITEAADEKARKGGYAMEEERWRKLSEVNKRLRRIKTPRSDVALHKRVAAYIDDHSLTLIASTTAGVCGWVATGNPLFLGLGIVIGILMSAAGGKDGP